MLKGKIRRYNNADPRYGFMIQDSDEYNTTIYPYRIKELCKSYNNKFYPRGVGCGGQRYENCEDIKKYDKESMDCGFFLYDNDNSNNKKNDNSHKKTYVIPKKLNKNTFLDKERLSKILYPNLSIDRAPDPNYEIHEDDIEPTRKRNPKMVAITGIENTNNDTKEKSLEYYCAMNENEEAKNMMVDYDSLWIIYNEYRIVFSILCFLILVFVCLLSL
jgi:hypothetical protein